VSRTAHIYAELEVGLHRIQGAEHVVELRYTHPESEAEVAPVRAGAAIDPEALLASQADPGAYGQALAAQLFSDPESRALYARAKTAVEASGLLLRLRLLIGPTAADLQALRWELLADPETGAPIATSEKTLFSRFLPSRDWRTVKLRPRAELAALVAVSAPSDLADYRLAAVDAAGETGRALASLGGIRCAVAGRDEPLTLDRLLEGMRQGVDLLYLVCHGALGRRTREPVLYLQDAGGRVAVVHGEELARRVSELAQPPRLAVLASCESAGSGVEGTAQAALAPRLAEAGVPAIVAMQGKISMATVEAALPVFFTELLRDGQIDRAMAVARGRVRERDDAWMPALFLRLKSGRIWYEPGFAGEGSDFARWRSICRRVRQGKVIPIVGPDAGEHLLGTSRELAERLAEAEGFPLAAHQRGDLAKVAQYLSVSQDRAYAQGRVLDQVRAQLLARNPEIAGEDGSRRPLPELLDAALERRRGDPDEPFRILSELPASIYLTASPETLLYKALKATGRQPALLVCDWRPSEESHPREPPFEGVPKQEAPVVYQVFGFFGRPESLVLTEDDFFDYLIASSTYKLIPKVVRGSLTESSLIFVGFRLEEWTFRVLFRMIMTLEGCAELRQYSHVGVQVDPEEHSQADVDRARRYLEGYFGSERAAGRGRGEPRIDIYWGSAADFLRELRRQLGESRDDETTPESGEEASGWF
jgi:CHAT domain/SIR2-like domain